MPDKPFDSSIEHVDARDGYSLAVRRFRPRESAACRLVILHGVVSHSEWLAPVAERLAGLGCEVLCPDRRGTGLCQANPGDAPDTATLVDDVARVVGHDMDDNLPVHLAGFCWGASYAIHAARPIRERLASLVLIAPSMFPGAGLGSADIVTGESSEASETPLVPLDLFTQGPAYEDYIIPDPLKTTLVSPRFNQLMVGMNALLAPRWVKLNLPSLVILAEDDRLADNEKHRKAFAMLRAEPKRLVTVPGEHGVQFDAPGDTAQHVFDWVSA